MVVCVCSLPPQKERKEKKKKTLTGVREEDELRHHITVLRLTDKTLTIKKIPIFCIVCTEMLICQDVNWIFCDPVHKVLSVMTKDTIALAFFYFSPM